MPSNWLFTQKRGQTTSFGFLILKRRIKIILFLLILVIGFFLFRLPVLGATPFEDDFNSYNLGDLYGQGSWVGGVSGVFNVVDTNCFEGKCINATIKTGYNWKLGNNTDNGQWLIFLNMPTPPISENLLYFYDSPLVNLVSSIATEGSNLKFYTPSGWKIFKTGIPFDEWFFITCQWQKLSEVQRQIRCKYENENFSEWFDTDNYPIGTLTLVGNLNRKFDYVVEKMGANLTITYPPSESEMIEAFNFEGIYNLAGEDWNKILIILEQWNEQSTCPEYGTPEFEEENGKGWFIYQSFPFFSDYLEEDGDFIAPVEDLRLGNYNCSRCYFINEGQGTISGEKCRGYTLNITGEIIYPFIPPVLPFKNWEDYYTENSEKYDTPTGLFTSIANALWGLIKKMGDFIVYVKTFFDPDEAMAKGTQLGGAIPIARGYLNSIDDFFGGLPISTFFIFYILCLAVVIAYKVILQIIKLLKP